MTWLVAGAQKDKQTVSAKWSALDQRLIDGVTVREVANVPKQNGHLTEVYRRDWKLDDVDVDQVFQVVLNAGAISAWHAHEKTTDRLFVSTGMVRIVLFDARDDSPTRGAINEFRAGAVRPALIVVPPRVWHGLQNIAAESSIVLNLVDAAYAYEDPDHWRVPLDDPSIPFRF